MSKRPSHLGITGTSKGAARKQSWELKKTIEVFRAIGFRSFHHGDCIGVDEMGHDYAQMANYEILIHPPENEHARAFCKGAVHVYDPLPYLVRNKAIVTCSDFLIACPQSEIEMQRSGTWHTVRCARKKNIPILTIYPNGRTRYEAPR